MKPELSIAFLVYAVSLVSFIQGNEDRDFQVKQEPWHAMLLVGDHCQVPSKFQGLYMPEAKKPGIELVAMNLHTDRIYYYTAGTTGLPKNGELYCIWNDDKHMIFAKDRFEEDLELAFCVEAELTDDHDLKLTIYNRWDRGPFQLNNSPSTSSNTCGDYPTGGTTVLLHNTRKPQLLDPDTCTMPVDLRGEYQVSGGKGLLTAKVGNDFIAFGFGHTKVTEKAKLWCIWEDGTRRIFAKDRYDGDLEIYACVVISETGSNDLRVEFLNREDRGLFQMGKTPTPYSDICRKSPREGAVIQFRRA